MRPILRLLRWLHLRWCLFYYLRLGVIIGTLPNNIMNGQTIDAVPVMADFNWIVNQVNANGAQLSLTPQLSATNTFAALNTFSGGIAVVSVASSFYEVGTYTATLTGGTTAPNYTVKWTRIGNQVTLMIPPWTVTSNNIAKTLTGMPAAIRPSGTPVVYGMQALVVDNTAGVAMPGAFDVLSTGVITLYSQADSLANWTAGGTASARPLPVTYTTA